MSEEAALNIVQNGLMTVIMASAPPLLLGLAVGLLVSIFQTITSIQEQTLAFVPKIMAVFIAIFLFGGWMWSLISGYMSELLDNLPGLL